MKSGNCSNRTKRGTVKKGQEEKISNEENKREAEWEQ